MMKELIQQYKVLELKVKVLEEALDTINSMESLDKTREFITQIKQVLKKVDLIFSESNELPLDFIAERNYFRSVQSMKLETMIAKAIADDEGLLVEDSNYSRYFEYELDTGVDQSGFENIIPNLNQYEKGIRITGYKGFDLDTVVVPEQMNHLPVTSIGEGVFTNATFSKVILPSSIKVISDYAFKGCNNLTEISIPEGPIYLGKGCFQGCGLTKFICPNSLYHIPDYCFYECRELAEVVLGNNITKLGYSAFSDCLKLKNLLLPDMLKKVDADCFNNTALKTVVFPANVEEISGRIFYRSIYSTSDYKRDPKREFVTCVFLGRETIIRSSSSLYDDSLRGVSLIYCLPGSKIQKFARENSIPMKPLNEFSSDEVYD